MHLRVFGWRFLLMVIVCSSGSAPAALAQMGMQNGPGMNPPAKRKPGEPLPLIAFSNGTGNLDARIVARVDDEIILLADVIGPVLSQLEQARKRMAAEQYRKFELEILRQSTQAKVQQLVILMELQSSLPRPEFLDQIRQQAKKEFPLHLGRLARKNGLADVAELEEKLTGAGNILPDMEREFVDNMISQQYLRQLIRSRLRNPTRDQLFRFYREHIEDYRTPVGAVWRHVQITGDLEKARDIHRRLLEGADFAELAKEHSSGPTATDGGLWCLTSEGSYADPMVDEAIFTLPIGEVSDVIHGKRGDHIIRVESRSNGEPEPFPEKQNEIRNRIQQEELNELHQSKLDELKAKHFIETIFDRQVLRTEPTLR